MSAYQAQLGAEAPSTVRSGVPNSSLPSGPEQRPRQGPARRIRMHITTGVPLVPRLGTRVGDEVGLSQVRE